VLETCQLLTGVPEAKWRHHVVRDGRLNGWAIEVNGTRQVAHVCLQSGRVVLTDTAPRLLASTSVQDVYLGGRMATARGEAPSGTPTASAAHHPGEAAQAAILRGGIALPHAGPDRRHTRAPP
jgi:hypothetical protein